MDVEVGCPSQVGKLRNKTAKLELLGKVLKNLKRTILTKELVELRYI